MPIWRGGGGDGTRQGRRSARCRWKGTQEQGADKFRVVVDKVPGSEASLGNPFVDPKCFGNQWNDQFPKFVPRLFKNVIVGCQGGGWSEWELVTR